MAKDIVIVGAGVVGLTSALLLARYVDNITIIEAKKFNNNFDENNYDLRCSAININSQKIFSKINLWQDLQLKRHGRYEKMFVWNKSSIEFDCQDINTKQLGYIFENRVILQSLWQKIAEHNNIKTYCPNTIKDLKINNNFCDITLNDNTTIQANLIIAADGANSWLRNYLNIETKSWDCKQNAIVATVKTSHNHKNIAWQKFTADGPIAFLPLDDPYTSTIVWSLNTKQALQLMELNSEDFNKQLTKTFENKLGETILVSDRFTIPLVMRHAQNYVLPKVALLGDAAHVIHPLAGQGLNLGLADAKALAAIIKNAIDKKQDIGSLAVLKKYQRSRKGSNLMSLIAMDLFKKIFCSSNSKIAMLRNVGLQIVNKQKWLKRYIIDYAES